MIINTETKGSTCSFMWHS